MEIPEIINGKSTNRVHKGYKYGTEDFNAQLDMLLPDGIKCSNCLNIKRCSSVFGQKEEQTSCQFYPNRYSPKPKNLSND